MNNFVLRTTYFRIVKIRWWLIVTDIMPGFEEMHLISLPFVFDQFRFPYVNFTFYPPFQIFVTLIFSHKWYIVLDLQVSFTSKFIFSHVCIC